MLRLGKQVGSHKLHVTTPVGNDGHFGGTCGHVDGHTLLADGHLGAHHELIARSENLAHAGHRFRTVGHGTDCLHAAQLVDGVHTGHTGCNQHGGVHLAVTLGRRTQDDVATSGNLGRRGEHQHRGKQWRRTSGDIQPHLFDGYGFLPALHPVGHTDVTALKLLGAMEGFDVAVRQHDGLLEGGVYQPLGFVHLFGRHGQPGETHLVELLLILFQGFVAALLHIVKHGTHHVFQFGHTLAGPFGNPVVGDYADHLSTISSFRWASRECPVHPVP